MEPLKNIQAENNNHVSGAGSKLREQEVPSLPSDEGYPLNQNLVKFEDFDPPSSQFEKLKAEPARNRGAASSNEFSDLEEYFHQITQRLELTLDPTRPLVLGVASAVRGEGRTTVAMGLAASIAKQLPVKVVLLEADLENPVLAMDLQLPNIGLSEYMRGEIEFQDLFKETTLPDFTVILAGDCKGEVLKTLRNEYFDKIITMLRYRFAVIIVDLPPMAKIGEAIRIINQTDLVLMVVKAGSTPEKQVKAALELVPEEKLIGVVLNRTRPAFGLFSSLGRFFKRSRS